MGRIPRVGKQSIKLNSLIKTNSFNFAQILEKVQTSNSEEDAFKISEEELQKPTEKMDLFQENTKLQNVPDNLVAVRLFLT
jgi:hypothetical protein